ncbi:hypothetical protein AB0958_25680 [Streptomyces sp. NPDC006655]|uniref:hypothetical protein n=1 Tax=Streptomyces sp. NPDC006655 TaxID=3156898 RepID=UPI0034555A57
MTAPRPRVARPGSGLRLLRAAVFAALCVMLAAAGHTMASCATVPLWTLGVGFLSTMALVAPLTGRARSLPGTVALLAVLQSVLHTLFGLGQHGGTAMAAGSAMTAGSPMSSGSSTPADDAALVQRAAELLCGAGAAQISPAHAYKILSAAHLGASGPVPGTSGSAMDMSAMAHAADATGSSASLLPSVPMLLGHLLAAVVAGWLLRRGDLALLRLLDLSAHGVTEGALVRSLRGALALACALCAGLVAAPEALTRDGRGTGWDEPPAPGTVTLQHSLLRRGPPAAAALDLAA